MTKATLPGPTGPTAMPDAPKRDSGRPGWQLKTGHMATPGGRRRQQPEPQRLRHTVRNDNKTLRIMAETNTNNDSRNGKKMSIEEFLDNDERKDLLRFLTAGSVDDGKSTLIGRLLYDSKKIYEDQLDALERDSKRMGNAGDHIDYALLLDGLKAEREQGITIDVAYRYFSTNKRKFIIADTPGHEQYTRNMITGGSTASLAVILVDARNGVITQTRRHTFLVSLLGIKHVVLAVNKMDLVGFAKETFDSIVADYMEFVKPLGIPDIQCIPLSALDGDNVVEKSDRTPWYDGPTLLSFLETVHVGSDQNFADFRFPVQYVLRPNLDFRGFCGKVASGVVHKGDEVVALPSGKKSRVKAIVTQDGDLGYAFPPQCVTLTLEDEIDVSRGEMLVHPDNLPTTSRCFEAMLVWMDEEPMDRSKQFYLKQTTNTTRARIDGIRYRVDVNTMEQSNADALKLNEIGKVVITTNKELFFDPYMKNKSCGSFIIIDPVTNNTSAVGMITAKADTADLFTPISDGDRRQMERGQSIVGRAEREERIGQHGRVYWIDGGDEANRNVLALTLERRLFDIGRYAVALTPGSCPGCNSAATARLLADGGIAVACCATPDEACKAPTDVCLHIAADGCQAGNGTTIAPDKMQQAVEDIINEA